MLSDIEKGNNLMFTRLTPGNDRTDCIVWYHAV